MNSRRRPAERGVQRPKINVNVSFDVDDFAAIEALARAAGVSVGKFVRECAVRTAAHAAARAQKVAQSGQ